MSISLDILSRGSLGELMPDNPDAKTREELSLAVRDGLAILANTHARYVPRAPAQNAGGPAPLGAGNPWTSRHGGSGLLGSFHTEWSDGALQGAYGSDSAKADKVEFGGEIKSSRARGMLAIPTEKAPRDVWPRYVPDLFLYKYADDKPPALARETGGGGLEILYWLVPRVKLRPHPTLLPAYDRCADKIDDRLLRALDRSIWDRN